MNLDTSATGTETGWLRREPPKRATIAVALACTAAIAIADVLTGPDLVLETFYLVPVAATAWFAGRSTALTIAVLAATAGVAGSTGQAADMAFPVYVWNQAFAFVAYTFVAVVVAATSRTMRAVDHLASTDSLTQTLNRRRFYEHAALELARARRTGLPVAVVYIDVDDLKNKNDTLGHEAGDAMLVEFAEVAREVLRATDLLARLGGDEFCFLLPGADLAAAHAAIDRLRCRLDGQPEPIRFSAGVVSGPVDRDLDVETIVHAADLLMLDAKTAGKGASRARASFAPS